MEVVVTDPEEAVVAVTAREVEAVAFAVVEEVETMAEVARLQLQLLLLLPLTLEVVAKEDSKYFHISLLDFLSN